VVPVRGRRRSGKWDQSPHPPALSALASKAVQRTRTNKSTESSQPKVAQTYVIDPGSNSNIAVPERRSLRGLNSTTTCWALSQGMSFHCALGPACMQFSPTL